MRLIALLVLVFGVVLAGGAIFFASEKFRAVEAALARRNTGPETVGVIVAGESLRQGNALTEQNVRMVQWPRGAVPDGAFTSLDDLFGTGDEEPRFVLRAIEPGEAILMGKISGFGERPRLVSTLSPGKRAFTLRIDALSGVAGFVAPGDQVDIVLTRTVNRELRSEIILQKVTVIAVDQHSDTESASPRLGRTATVEVTPEEMLMLTTAQQAGKLTLALRGADEIEPVTDVGAFSSRDFDPEAAPEPTPVPEAGSVGVVIRRGVDEVRREFKEEEPTGAATD